MFLAQSRALYTWREIVSKLSVCLIDDIYHSVENNFPSFIFAFLDCLEEEFTVLKRDHLLVYQTLVACLIMWLEWQEASCFCWVHAVNVNFDCHFCVSKR